MPKKKKLTRRAVKAFIKDEIQAAHGYHPYSKANRGIKEIELDEVSHKKFFQRKLKKMKRVS
jgi:hypothetical protein